MRTPTRSDGSDATAVVRALIVRIAAEREALHHDVGRSLVDRAGVQQAIRQQRSHLAAARAGLDVALTAATGLLQSSRGPAETARYRQHLDGLRRQLDVLDAATRQLDDQDVAAAAQQERARTALAASSQALDAALREQVRRLGALELAQRERVSESGQCGPTGR